jgi:DNA-binding transcriptional regulator YiaG
MSSPSIAREISTVRQYCRDGSARAIREAAELRLADIAREVGVSVETVSAWERNKQRPTGENAIAYLALLRALSRPTERLVAR